MMEIKPAMALLMNELVRNEIKLHGAFMNMDLVRNGI